MRLTLHLLGVEVFGLAFNEPTEPETCSLDGGTTSSYPVGFAPTPHPPWERPMNQWDEPGEADEDVRPS